MVGIMPKKTKKVAKKSASKAAEPKKEVITAEALSMEFCEKCGSLMLPQKNSMKCRRCGASKRGTVTGLKIVTGRKKIKGIPVLEKDETPLPQMGKAMYYANGVMEQVIKYRLRVGDITPGKKCLGYVALMRKGDLDREVWIVINGQVEGPFCVVDVAALQHIPSLLERNWVVDVDYQTAKRWGMAGVGPKFVVVLGAPPPNK